MNLKAQMQKLGITQVNIAKELNCRPQQVYSALMNHDQPTLLKKIEEYIKSFKHKSK